MAQVVSESGIASGIRRIEAVAGAAAVEYLDGLDAIARALSTSLKVWLCDVCTNICTNRTPRNMAHMLPAV